MIIPRWLLIVFILTLHSSFTAALQFEDWHCGSDTSSRKYSYAMFGKDCPASTENINHCCVIHDDCYVKQYGQDRCDREFCECNKRALALTNGTSGCKDHVAFICLMMPYVGGFAYAESAGWKEPADLKLYSVEDRRFQEPYSQVYANCTDQNTTISSCAYSANKCFGEKRSEYLCSLDFISCISEAGSRSRFPNCLLQITHMINVVRKEIPFTPNANGPSVVISSESDANARTLFILNNFSLSIMCVLASLCVVFLMMFIYRSYRRRKAEKDNMDGIKYAVVA